LLVFANKGALDMRQSIFCLALAAASLLSSFAKAEENYLFFSPQTIESYLQGYNEEEKVAIGKDLEVVRSVCLCNTSETKKVEAPLYLATAGGPGARKSTILERFLRDHSLIANTTYIDPDQRALKFMSHTYYSQSLSSLVIGDYENYAMAVKSAYEKWRGASNFIAFTLLEESFLHKKNIAHGTTSTAEHTSKFLAKVKDAGYDVVLLLCSCEDAFRKRAIQYRNEEQKFYQSTPEDALIKGKLFPQRMPAYFTYADTLYLYWSDDLATQERLAAILQDGDLKVLDTQALNLFIQKFENDRELLKADGKHIPCWDELVTLYHNRF
jgi:hypothetical protein